MLSRKTRSQVIELLLSIQQGVGCVLAAERAAMQKECVAALSAVQNICRDSLSPERFAVYAEPLATLREALDVGKTCRRGKDDGDIAALCQDLCAWLVEALGKEPVKKEILFLPYKAAMWDCLESIWQAADADREHCNVYVATIPYAEFTPEHTVKAWRWEKELLPAEVPVLDYRMVALEKLRPDVIFIHNPYDGGNCVTSVDARYYSQALKTYTDHLVYVTYFVAGDEEEMYTAFFDAAGLATVDHVVVESAFVKAQYERHYHWGTPPPGKYVALGSPKYDKVEQGTKAAYPLPKAWQRIPREGRKILLYNTSLHASLEAPYALCQKTQQVLDFFHRRKDVLLWWRPHPLLEASLEAMYPAIAQEYRNIRMDYQAQDWGIYDATPEMTRAVLWADAYYGDVSGVLWTFQRTGKPILIEDIPLANEVGSLSCIEKRKESDFHRTPEEEAARKNPLHREQDGWRLADFLHLVDTWKTIPMGGKGGAGQRIYAWAMGL